MDCTGIGGRQQEHHPRDLKPENDLRKELRQPLRCSASFEECIKESSMGDWEVFSGLAQAEFRPPRSYRVRESRELEDLTA